MSKTVLQDFLVKIGFKTDTAQLAAANAGMAKAGASAALLDKEATAAAVAVDTKLIPSLRAMLLPLTAVTAAIGFAYKEMFHFVESSAEGFDEVAKLSNRVNATATNILKLGYIAQVSGSSVEAARASLDGLNKAAGETALGIGRAKIVFKDIGISVKNSNGHLKDTGDLLLEIGDKIKGMERGKQLAILEKLRIDPTLIESLTTDVSGLGKEFDQLYKSAGIDAEKAARSSQEFIDTLDKVKFVFKTIKDAVAASFFDEFRDGAESFRKLLMHNLPKIIASLKPIITDMVKIGSIVVKLGLIFGGMASNMISLITKINDLTGGWAVKIAAVTYAWKKLNFAFLRSPIGIIIELATAFSLLYDDYKTWERGGKSFIDWGKKSTFIISNLIADFSLLVGGIYLFNTAMRISKAIIVTYNSALVVLRITAGKTREAMQLLSAVMETGFLGVYATLGLIVADVVLLVDKIKELKSLLAELNSTQKGTEARSNVLKKYAGSLSFLPGGVLGASLYNPQNVSSVSNNKNVTINHKTDINVNGAGNPYETAVAVKNQQRYIYGDQIRYQQGAVR